MSNEMDRLFENSKVRYSILHRFNENEYMISLAVAGFNMDNLEITKDKNTKIEGTGSSRR